MSNRVRKLLSIVALSLLVPGTALAHPGHGGGNLMAGVLHPLTGLDHVLMIVAISAWASSMSSSGRIAIAACLALFVGVGAVLPVNGGASLETAIALTVVGAGMLLAAGRYWPLWATGLVAAVFALVHGLAHGSEGPNGSVGYVVGLMLATAGLSAASSLVIAKLHARSVWVRIIGVSTAAAGMLTLAAG